MKFINQIILASSEKNESESTENNIPGSSNKKVLRRRGYVCYKDVSDSLDSDQDEILPPAPPAFSIYRDDSSGW